jgi:hypothetical protein
MHKTTVAVDSDISAATSSNDDNCQTLNGNGGDALMLSAIFRVVKQLTT